MKRWLRRPGVQRALGAVLAAYLRLALRLIRWRHEGLERAEGVWDAGGGVVVCFWHARIGLSPACWPLDRAQAPRALISLSADGSFVAEAMARLGFPAIRGSAAKGSDPAKAKGGAQAFREVLRWLRAGNGVAVTPDGPRGPPEKMTDGPAMLARLSASPTLLVGLAARPCIRLDTWDRAVLPLPFARGAIVWDGPIAPPGATADLAALGADWAARLTAATARAEALV
ncbi:MAG: lysophospholipid acyltransferase family protein, partial [Caulobacteraceae bacterium]|nr:lysophospholipid acyltransferase family protein [Caulobacter sp.]